MEVMGWGRWDGWLHNYTRFDGEKLRKSLGAHSCAASSDTPPEPQRAATIAALSIHSKRKVCRCDR